ncbi:hypothetical protein NN561_000128 [Cricetulus griseus]
MDFGRARRAVLQLLGATAPADVPALLHWMRTTRDFDEFTQDNNDIMLKNIADDLRSCLPQEAVLCSEQLALQKIRQQPEPTVHVDAFLYDEDVIDSLCEEGKMSRNYCTACGSHQTAPLGFISHSFSLEELKFIYQHVLPDLSGKVLVDIGSRLGTVLYAGQLAWERPGRGADRRAEAAPSPGAPRTPFFPRVLCSSAVLLHRAGGFARQPMRGPHGAGRTAARDAGMQMGRIPIVPVRA